MRMLFCESSAGDVVCAVARHLVGVGLDVAPEIKAFASTPSSISATTVVELPVVALRGSFASASDQRSVFVERGDLQEGRYCPKTSRRVSETSPTVARFASASFIG